MREGEFCQGFGPVNGVSPARGEGLLLAAGGEAVAVLFPVTGAWQGVWAGDITPCGSSRTPRTPVYEGRNRLSFAAVIVKWMDATRAGGSGGWKSGCRPRVRLHSLLDADLPEGSTRQEKAEKQ